MPAAGIAHQVDRTVPELLEEGNHVIDMLRDRIGVADTVPLIRKEMPQADADHAVSLRQQAVDAAPDAKIVQRAVHANQRRPLMGLAYLEIGHVVAVDGKGLHAGLAEKV